MYVANITDLRRKQRQNTMNTETAKILLSSTTIALLRKHQRSYLGPHRLLRTQGKVVYYIGKNPWHVRGNIL